MRFVLLSREQFKERVFARDKYKCVVCGLEAKDAHHILERKLWPDGGYYLEKGLVVNTAKDRAKVYLAAGQDFIWNATNITTDIRRGLVDMIVEYNGKPNIVYVEKPYDIWLKQNKSREKAVPENVLHHMLSKLQVPTVEECVELDYEF